MIKTFLLTTTMLLSSVSLAKTEYNLGVGSPYQTNGTLQAGLTIGGENAFFAEIGYTPVYRESRFSDLAMGYQKTSIIIENLEIKHRIFLGHTVYESQQVDFGERSFYFLGFTSSIGPIGVGFRVFDAGEFTLPDGGNMSVYPYLNHVWQF